MSTDLIIPDTSSKGRMDINAALKSLDKQIRRQRKKGVKISWKPLKPVLVSLLVLTAMLLLFLGFKNVRPAMVSNLTLDKLWEYKTLAPVFSTAAIVDLNNDSVNDILISSMDGKLYALEGRAGKRMFHFETGFPMLGSPSVVRVGRKQRLVVFPGGDGTVYALNGRNQCVWSTIKRDLDTEVISTPVFIRINDDPVPDVIVAGKDGHVYALDGNRGWQIWRSRETSGRFFATPLAVQVNDDMVKDLVIGSPEGIVYCLDGATGTKIWETRVNGPVDSSAVLLDKDTLAVGDETGMLYRFRLQTGNIIDQKNLQASIISTPALVNQHEDPVLVVPLKNGTIAGLNAADFSRRWLYETKYEDPFVSSPAVYDLNRDGGEDILVASRNGHLYLISGTDGQNIIDPFFTGNSVSSSPVLADVNADGYLDVIFGSENGKVTALTLRTVPDRTVRKNEIVYGSFLNRNHEQFQ